MQATTHKTIYMIDRIKKLDDFLKLPGKELPAHSGKKHKEVAKEKADAEYDKLKERS
ncbi:hypothetical protein D7D25_13075 [Proteiniphilum sp. X52]|nr:hypothetical protein D7D25_13075 [Proteiniphilum sp. X52]